jgi:hypothetical protein
MTKGEGSTYRFFGRNPPPHVSPRVVPHRLTHTTGLTLILPTDSLDLTLNIKEAIKGDVRDLVFLAILLETETATSKENVCFAGSG